MRYINLRFTYLLTLLTKQDIKPYQPNSRLHYLQIAGIERTQNVTHVVRLCTRPLHQMLTLTTTLDIKS